MGDINEVRIWPRTATKRNPFTLVIGMIGDREDLGTWYRSGAHKGIRVNTVLASRPMTAQEVETEMKSYRLHFQMYKDWHDLILDEYLSTYDLNWTKELIEISRQNITLLQIITEGLKPR